MRPASASFLELLLATTEEVCSPGFAANNGAPGRSVSPGARGEATGAHEGSPCVLFARAESRLYNWVAVVMPFGTNLVAAWLSAAPVTPIHVTVDWSGVSDRTVSRCGLAGLQAMLLQTLLESGFAVVEQAESTDVTVSIRERRRQLRVEARGGGASRTSSVDISGRCDGTVQFLLQRATVSTLRRLRETGRLEPPPAIDLGSTPQSAVRPLVRVGATANSAAPFLVAAAGLRLYASESTSFRVAGELAYRRTRGLSLFEPALAAVLTRRWLRTGPIEWRAGVGLAVLAHVFADDDGSSGHVDLQARVPLTWEWSSAGLFLELVVHARAKPVVHRLDGAEVFRSGHLGGGASLGYSFGARSIARAENPEPPRASFH